MKKFTSIGPLVVDLVVSLENIPEPGKMNYVSEEEHGKIRKNLGGHAAIVATDLAKLQGRGDMMSVVGAIGNDENGNFLKSNLRETGIASKLYESQTPTAENIIIAVRGEEKRYDLHPGANLDLDAEYVVKALEEYKPEIIYCCPGYTGIDSDLKAIFKKIKQNWGSFIFLDIVDPYEKSKQFVKPALKYVDAFKLNDAEAKVISGTSSVHRSLEEFINLGLNNVFITRGPKGVKGVSGNKLISQPPFEVESLDQTGCGDAFSAGLISKMIEQDKLPSSMDSDRLSEVLAYGQATGAIAATKAGATTAISSKSVSDLLFNQKERILKETEIKDFS